MNALTVKELERLCREQIAAGNGAKVVLISCDDEGNGFHTLYFGFTDNKDTIELYDEMDMFHDGNNPEDVVLLG